MGCILSICKKKQIQAPESEVVSIRNDSFTDQNQNTSTPEGGNYFEEDSRNDNYFYAMLHYSQIKATLSQIISNNVNNKLSREGADPILDQLRLRISQYKNQIQEENRRYKKYLKDLNSQQKISELNSETDNEKSGTGLEEVKTITLTPADRIQGGVNQNSQQMKSAFKSTIDQNDPQKSTIEQNGENSQKIDDDLQQQSSPFKYIKPQSNANEFNDNSQNKMSLNRKSNFDDSKNLTKDKLADDSSLEDIQLSEMLKKNLNFTQTTLTPLNQKRRQTEKGGSSKNDNEEREDKNTFAKKNTEQISQNRTSGISTSTPTPQQNLHQGIIRNFFCEKINLIKPKQIIIDIQQAVYLLTPNGQDIKVRISTKSKHLETNKQSQNNLKFFQVFQINLDADENQFQLTFLQNENEITQPQTFQLNELMDQKVHVKNLHFKYYKGSFFTAILMIKVQYIHDLLEIQKYWQDEADARLKQIDQIKNYISSRKQPGTNSYNIQQNTLNNLQTLLSNDLNSQSEDGSSYFDNQFYAK